MNRVSRRIGSAGAAILWVGSATITPAQDVAPASATEQAAAAAVPVQLAANDEIVVLGSQRATAAIKSAVPVDVVGQAALERTGTVNLNQALQRLLPSFNFPQTQNAVKGTYGTRSASLRRLPPDLTLILVDGKRRNPSSRLAAVDPYRVGQFVDLSAVPVNAIERVEVLRDGASAQYGSDAIAGVINLILKKRTEGIDINAQIGEYTRGDGFTKSIGLTVAQPLTDDGFIDLSVNASTRDATDRSGPDWRQRYFPGDPREQTADRNAVGRWGNANTDNIAVLANSEVGITDALRAYGTANFSMTDTRNRVNPTEPKNDGNLRAFNPDGVQPQIRGLIYDTALTAGLRYDGGDIGSFDLGVSAGRNVNRTFVYDSASPSYGLASQRSFYLGKFRSNQVAATLDYVRDFDLGLAKPANFSAGLTYRHEKWEAAEPGDVQSWSNGGVPILDGPNRGKATRYGSDIGGLTPDDLTSISRDVWGGYAGIDIFPIDGVTIGAAGRIENYSDFGTTTTGKLSARWDLTPAIAIRGAYSTGFHAPGIALLGSQTTSSTGIFSFSGQLDEALSSRTRFFRPDDPAVAPLGAKALDPEKSRNISAGLVLQPIQGATLTVDVYQINIDGFILSTDGANANGLTGPFVAAATAAAGLATVKTANFFLNGLDTRTRGLDAVARYQFKAGAADTDLSLAFSTGRTKLSNVKAAPAGSGLTYFSRSRLGDIEDGTPNWKVIAGAHVTLDRFDFDSSQVVYGPYTYTHPTVAANDQHYDPQWVTNVEVGYSIADDTRFAVGAQNLFNTYPAQYIRANQVNGINRYGFIHPDGANGRFVYASVRQRF